MSESRRWFLSRASCGLLSTAAACRRNTRDTNELPKMTAADQPPPGAPPAFGTAPAAGPSVTAATFAEAGNLMNVQLTATERDQAAGNWRNSMAPLYERRTGPRRVPIEPTLAPYSRWDPVMPGERARPSRDHFTWSQPDPGPLPARDEDIAFAPLTQL